MRYRKFLFIVFAFVLSMLTFNVNAKTEKYNIISGDLKTVGSEVCFGDECFYVISNDGKVVSLFAKYNLYVGYSIDESGNYTELEPTYLQDSRALGFRVIDGSRDPLHPFVGTVPFSDVSNKYDGSIVQGYVNEYSSKLSQLGLKISSSRLITVEELESLGCSANVDAASFCRDALFEWVYSSSYWVGDPGPLENLVWRVSVADEFYFGFTLFDVVNISGVRPVIEVPLGYFDEGITQNIFAVGVEKVELSEGVDTNASGEVDLIFNNLGQFANYEAIIYNDSDDVMYIDQLSVTGISKDFVDIRLNEKTKNKAINPRSATKVGFTVKLLEKADGGTNFEDDITLKFRLINEIKNPNTFSNIFEVIILITVFGGTIYFVRKINNKKVELLVLIGVISFAGMIYVNAKDYVNIEFKGKIKYVSENIIKSTGVEVLVDDYNGEFYIHRGYANDIWRVYQNSIEFVEIKNKIEEPEQYYKKFDLTAYGKGKIFAYLVEDDYDDDDDDETEMKLIIMSNKKIIANKDSSFLFGFDKLKEIEGLSNIDFSNAESMKGMFFGANLETIELDALDISNVKDTSYMFYGCSSLEIDEDDFNLENVINKEKMFAGRSPI